MNSNPRRKAAQEKDGHIAKGLNTMRGGFYARQVYRIDSIQKSFLSFHAQHVVMISIKDYYEVCVMENRMVLALVHLYIIILINYF